MALRQNFAFRRSPLFHIQLRLLFEHVSCGPARRRSGRGGVRGKRRASQMGCNQISWWSALPRGFLLFVLSPFSLPSALGLGLALPFPGSGRPLWAPCVRPPVPGPSQGCAGSAVHCSTTGKPKCLMPNVAQGTLARCAERECWKQAV